VKRILIPVEGSAKSLEAVRATVREGPNAVARIDLVNVQPLFNRHIACWIARDQREAWRSERSQRALARAKKIVEMSGIPCETHSAAGPVAPMVAATAKRLRCHEIVVSSRQRSLLGRLLANSVSTRLIEVSSVPVRVIPAGPAPLVGAPWSMAWAEALALPAGLSLIALLIFVAD
jgi:nucleotide-binding universal stress UspA family protein